jgi:4-hydroxy-tetrahydrodipicolinate synthase
MVTPSAEVPSAGVAGDNVVSQRLKAGLGGVVAVLIAPFSDDGSLAIEATERLAGRVDAGGAHALTALGNTAELFQLTAQEGRDYLVAVANARQSAALVAGVAGSFRDCLSYAEFAADHGYEAIMLHDPADPLASQAGIEAYVRAIADASPLPVILYPRSLRLSVDALCRLAEHSRVVGIKYGVANLAAIAELSVRLENSACSLICGLAESAVPTFAGFGVTGFTSGLANVRPDLALRVWQAVRAGELDALVEGVRRVLEFELLRIADNGRFNVAVVKEALTLIGEPSGLVRPPCEDLDQATRTRVRAVVDSWGPP